MEHQTSYSQPSPPSSVAEQAWDKNLTDHDGASHILESEMNDAALLPARLIRVAQILSESNSISISDSTTIHHCLQEMEALLDPRPAFSQEVARCRPRAHSRPPSPVDSPRNPHISSITPVSTTANHHGDVQEIPHSQLRDLLKEVTAMKTEFSQRRRESLEIHSLLTQERQALTQRLTELDDEIHELRKDILEDLAEREAMQGTINGLEIWVDDWHKQHLLAVAEGPTMKHRRKNQRRWTKCAKEEQFNDDGEALFEGITAWMRGWKDIEEGFHIRQKDRDLRRERRREQMERQRDHSQTSLD
ncbi:hypothetical protein ASPACDRAFT_45306 [Aspergillus aculeatus ATCC 16872]|uniref:Uncharacterized protein n=1 Tax=Aspergillus aculeatus (strain ATCC 16872 / CBS 172.66 / WB 5094) TaxID=690307 RepID=A0A1L9WPC4_ASPA1|nr:uncharacterized protein ASPACDRAFT_45306 [Aspergillus aculeatus ATCC 16872]OJJ98006.1 hypothetical protein ASPACDRAFT_45306 [Aspergillus aculeatus ATCC 16872]